MRRSRFSVEQIVAALKQTELGLPVAKLIRRLGISEQTFYRWTDNAHLSVDGAYGRDDDQHMQSAA